MDLEEYYRQHKEFIVWYQKRILRITGIMFVLVVLFVGLLMFFTLPEFWPWN